MLLPLMILFFTWTALNNASSMFTESYRAAMYTGEDSRVTPKECYIIALKDGTSDSQVAELKSYLIANDTINFQSIFKTLNMLHVCSALPNIQNVLTVPFVKFIEREKMVQQAAVQSNVANWGLDIMDGTLDGSYSYSRTGKGVTIYLLDTGINVNHVEFLDSTGKISRASLDQSFLGNTAIDSGHGSHAAGIAAGRTVGVAKDSNIVMLQVLNDGKGTTSVVLNALNTIYQSYQSNPIPCVISLSLDADQDNSINDTVDKLVAAGIPVVVAAGNAAADASLYSPASAPGAITVAASDNNNNLATFSNFGSSVTIVAPGVDIVSANYNDNAGYVKMSGTSMSNPLVAGVVALILEENPKATPAEIKDILTKTAVAASFPKNTAGLLLKSPYSNQQTPSVSPAPPNSPGQNGQPANNADANNGGSANTILNKHNLRN